MTRALISISFALAIVTACTIEVEHDLGISLDHNSKCLTCLPMCSTHATHCVTTDGDPCEGCNVACLAASAYECIDMEPMCYQRVGEDRVLVPTLCVVAE